MIYYAQEGNEGTVGVIDESSLLSKLKFFHSQKKVNNENMIFWLYLPFTKEVKYKNLFVCCLNESQTFYPKSVPMVLQSCLAKDWGQNLSKHTLGRTHFFLTVLLCIQLPLVGDWEREVFGIF